MRPLPLLLSATLLTLSVLPGCDRGTRGVPVKTPAGLVVVIGPREGHPQWRGIRGGVLLAGQRFTTYDVEFVSPGGADEAALLDAAERALARSPKAVCLFVPTAEVAGQAIDRLLRGGAQVVTMGTPAMPDRVGGHVDATFPAGAELLGESLQLLAGSGKSYVLVHHFGGSTLATQCYDRFTYGARHQFGMTMLEERSAEQGGVPVAQVVRDLVERFRNTSLVVTLSPEPWLSESPAELLGESNRFAALSTTPALWPHLRSGKAAGLVGPIDGEIGSYAVEIAVRLIADDKTVGTLHNVHCELVTGATLDAFARRYADAAGIPVSELLPGGAAQP